MQERSLYVSLVHVHNSFHSTTTSSSCLLPLLCCFLPINCPLHAQRMTHGELVPLQHATALPFEEREQQQACNNKQAVVGGQCTMAMRCRRGRQPKCTSAVLAAQLLVLDVCVLGLQLGGALGGGSAGEACGRMQTVGLGCRPGMGRRGERCHSQRCSCKLGNLQRSPPSIQNCQKQSAAPGLGTSVGLSSGVPGLALGPTCACTGVVAQWLKVRLATRQRARTWTAGTTQCRTMLRKSLNQSLFCS